MKVYLLTGSCGTGKTWVAKQLIERFSLNNPVKVGLYHWRESSPESLAVLGKYEGEMYDGSDRLSMSIMAENKLITPVFKDRVVFAEGDRFSNSTFIADFDPIIIFIRGTGAAGREMRGSAQTARHIKAISTRVNKIPYSTFALDSADALRMIIEDINNPVLEAKNYKQESLFFSEEN